MKNWLLLGLLWLLTSCMGVPANVKVVEGVDAKQYLGTWYEIARLDHRFERGMENVTANYENQADGSIKVTNKAYDAAKKEWANIVGKAYFVEAQNADKTYVGKLKVSFFGPFYGAYNIIALDKANYQHVMICGPSKDYLWILARTPKLAETTKQALIDQAKSLGFATNKLIFVSHDAVLPK